MRDFIIKNDSDYHFCIHFCYPIDDPRYNTEEELLIITNEESSTPLSQLKQRIQHVRDYDRFKTCRVFVVNLNNEIHPVSEPLSAFELKGELEERSLFDVDVCSVVDFAEIRDLVCHKFELDSFERNKK